MTIPSEQESGSAQPANDLHIGTPSTQSGSASSPSGSQVGFQIINDLAPPEAKEYGTLDEAEAAVEIWAVSHGYAVIRGRTKKSEHKNPADRFIRKVWLMCVARGDYTDRRGLDDGTRKRDRGSRKSGCPFEAHITKTGSTWVVSVQNGAHMHTEDFDHLACHEARSVGVSDTIKSEIMRKAATATPRKSIMADLQKAYPNLHINKKDVSNFQAVERVKKLDGRTPIEALLDHLKETNEFHKVNVADNGQLRHLFFISKPSMALLLENPHVFLLDCTYKTNKYKMPLMHIVGTTAAGTTFSAGFAFMSQEKEDDYRFCIEQLRAALPLGNSTVFVTDRELALINSLKEFFPDQKHILCIWHINKNILANCKPGFSEEDWADFLRDWQAVMNAPTEAAMVSEWDKFSEKWRGGHCSAVDYINDTWVAPWKTKFMSAWLTDVTHFGHLFTSRAEGAHAHSKNWLATSTMDLNSVYEKILLFLAEQGDTEKSQRRTMQGHTLPSHTGQVLWQKLNRVISYPALRHLKKQREESLKLTNETAVDCTGTYRATMGLPCKHEIYHATKAKISLPLSDVHVHWWLKKPVAPAAPLPSVAPPPMSDILDNLKNLFDESAPHIQNRLQETLDGICKEPTQLAVHNPAVVKGKGRPTGSVNKNRKGASESSTRRDPSLFEHVEAQITDAAALGKKRGRPKGSKNKPKASAKKAKRKQAKTATADEEAVTELHCTICGVDVFICCPLCLKPLCNLHNQTSCPHTAS